MSKPYTPKFVVLKISVGPCQVNKYLRVIWSKRAADLAMLSRLDAFPLAKFAQLDVIAFFNLPYMPLAPLIAN